MKKWSEYYRQWHEADYLRHVKAVKGFCHRVARFTPDNGSILEVGFGTGQMSIYLSLMKDRNFICQGIDSDIEQPKRALMLARELKSSALFWQCDLEMFTSFREDLIKFDTVFSQGLLEHFEVSDIQEMIRQQFILGKVVAFSVPLDKFGHKSRGDEILRPENEWKEIVKGYETLFWETYADGKQLMGILKEVKK